MLSYAYMRKINDISNLKERPKKTGDFLQKKLYSELPKVFSSKQILKQIDELQEAHGFSDSLKQKITSKKEMLDLKYQGRNKLNLFCKKDQSAEVTAIDILLSLQVNYKNSYASHYTALYLLDLVQQKPKDFMVSLAIKDSYKRPKKEISQFLIQQLFMKPSKVTSNYFSFKSNNYYILERTKDSYVGIVHKRFNFEKGKDVILAITDKERTLIDCLMAPQYSGGLLNVVNAFKEQDFEINRLFEYYDTLNPIYPYWQNIGLFFDNSGNSKLAKEWMKCFKNKNSVTFYLDHNFRTNWSFSEKWSVYYPEGVFK